MNKIGIMLLGVTLASCTNNTENSDIIGSWITDACEQLTDSNNQPVNVWAKSTYTFDTLASIYIESTSYSDSNCITKSNAITTTLILLANFSEQGPVTTSQGIEANTITISFSSASPPIITTSGYYKITSNQICLSEGYHFGASSFSIGKTNDTEIDFINCLTKK